MKKLLCMFLCIMVFVLSLNTYAMNGANIYKYELKEDGIVILGIDIEQIPDNNEITIPSSIDGYNVLEIGEYAFSGSAIKKAVIQNGVKKIGSYAFSGCTSLESVELPDTLEIIDTSAFSGCNSLKEITCPSKLKTIGTSAFDRCTNLQNIILNEGIEEIGSRAFADCDNIKNIIIPKSCKTINGAPNAATIEYCDKLEVVEIYGTYENLCLFIADCPNLKAVVFHGDIEDTVLNNFKYNFYACEPRYKKVNPRIFTEQLDIVIKANEGTNIEKFAKENGFNFEMLSSDTIYDNSVPDISNIDISKYTESETHKVYRVIPTEYGVVLYMRVVGAPRDGGPFLMLIRETGEEIILSESITKETPSKYAEHNDIQLSEDGKFITFNVSFAERSEGDVAGQTVVVHDAGTYYYTSDLVTGKTIESSFEPLDEISEDILSVWAKPEVKKAIELGIVPSSLRENYTRNITRGEFAKLAMYFLARQYGFQSESEIKTYYMLNSGTAELPSGDFINDYCSAKTDRNGEQFLLNDEPYEYHRQRGILNYLTSPFADIVESDERYYIIAAYNIGIVNGISETAFNPEGDITRQEAAAMLMRVYSNYGHYAEGNSIIFQDNDAIADWAKADVYAISDMGVMQGVGAYHFAPNDNYTVEQAIATFVRLYEWMPGINNSPLMDYTKDSEKFFASSIGTGGFHKISEEQYTDFNIVYGYWHLRHGHPDYTVYVFYKGGGMRNLMAFTPTGGYNSYEITDIKVNDREKSISFVTTICDSFRLYNKFNSDLKVYGIGNYRLTFNLNTGNLVSLVYLG